MEGKVYCKAVFVMAMNEYTNQWEPMCYFPEQIWGNGGSLNQGMTYYDFTLQSPFGASPLVKTS